MKRFEIVLARLVIIAILLFIIAKEGYITIYYFAEFWGAYGMKPNIVLIAFSFFTLVQFLIFGYIVYRLIKAFYTDKKEKKDDNIRS